MTPVEKRILGWKRDPISFVIDNFNPEKIDEWQLDALRATGGLDNPRRRIGLKACTGPGKSTVLSWLGWHRLSCFAIDGEHPKGAALSGEGRDNLQDNLWAELSKWQQRSEILAKAFTWNQARIFSNKYPETWFLSARSYPKDADTEAIGRSLSGLHSKFPFVLLDEIGGMPTTVGQKASQIFTGGVVDGLIAAAGNPTSTDGLLYSISTKERDVWNIITITADPDDPKRTPRVSIEHAREQIKLHGRENPWVKATILGEFPDQSFNSLLSVSEVEASMMRTALETNYNFAQKRLGVDVARFGSDRTVLFPRQGLAAFEPIEMRNARTPEIAARVMLAKSKWNSEMEFIDDTGGFGAGVIDSLLLAGVHATPINFASKAIDSRYYNKRAEIWFLMSEWVKRGGCLPNIPSMVQELTTPTYTFQNGRFLIEPKEHIKERLGFSPDYADALSLTFSIPDMPKSESLIGKFETGIHKLKYEYDPFASLN